MSLGFVFHLFHVGDGSGDADELGGLVVLEASASPLAKVQHKVRIQLLKKNWTKNRLFVHSCYATNVFYACRIPFWHLSPSNPGLQAHDGGDGAASSSSLSSFASASSEQVPPFRHCGLHLGLFSLSPPPAPASFPPFLTSLGTCLWHLSPEKPRGHRQRKPRIQVQNIKIVAFASFPRSVSKQ